MAKTGEELSDEPVALPGMDLEVEVKGSTGFKEARRSNGDVVLDKRPCFENSSA